MKNILSVALLAVMLFATNACAVDSNTSGSKRYFESGEPKQEGQKLEEKTKEQQDEKPEEKNSEE